MTATVAPPSTDVHVIVRDVVGVPPSAPVNVTDTVPLAVCEMLLGIGASGVVGEKTAAPLELPLHPVTSSPLGPAASPTRSAVLLAPRTLEVTESPSMRYATTAQLPLMLRRAMTVKTPVELTFEYWLFQLPVTPPAIPTVLPQLLEENFE